MQARSSSSIHYEIGGTEHIRGRARSREDEGCRNRAAASPYSAGIQAKKAADVADSDEESRRPGGLSGSGKRGERERRRRRAIYRCRQGIESGRGSSELNAAEIDARGVSARDFWTEEEDDDLAQ
jgi:hypothetical protein